MQIFIRHKQTCAGLAGLALAIILVTALAPMERTLGDRVRLVYLHGAWVWAGKVAFAAAAVCGFVGWISSTRIWMRQSVAIGWTGLFFWVTYLPMSLLFQQINWGGIFWDEPRWRIPFMFGIVSILIQTGLWLIENLRAASIVNLCFGVALWWFLGNLQNVLHPDSPILQSDAWRIQLFFGVILALALIFGLFLARLLLNFVPERWK